jgi:hypothetical protein
MLFKIENSLILADTKAEALNIFMQYNPDFNTSDSSFVHIDVVINVNRNHAFIDHDFHQLGHLDPAIMHKECMNVITSKYGDTYAAVTKICNSNAQMKLGTEGGYSKQQFDELFKLLLDTPYNESRTLLLLCQTVANQTLRHGHLPDTWHDLLINHISKFWIVALDGEIFIDESNRQLLDIVSTSQHAPVSIRQKHEPEQFLERLIRYAYAPSRLQRLINRYAVSYDTLEDFVRIHPSMTWIMDLYDFKQKLIKDGTVVINNEPMCKKYHQKLLQ